MKLKPRPSASYFAVITHGTAHWKDPATAAAFKLQVKEPSPLR
jgi:hypothetical protein